VHFSYEAGPIGYGLRRLIRLDAARIPASFRRLHTQARSGLSAVQSRTIRFLNRLHEQQFDHLPIKRHFEKWSKPIQIANDRVNQLAHVIEEFLSPWSLALIARCRLCGLRKCSSRLSALRRRTALREPEPVHRYPRLAPCERSTGEKVRSGAATRSGNRRRGCR
jgi:hypothetical protein